MDDLFANAPPFSGFGDASLFLILYVPSGFCVEPAVFLPAFLILCAALAASPVLGLFLNLAVVPPCVPDVGEEPEP